MRLSNSDLQRVLFSVNQLNSDHEPESLPRRTFDAVKSLAAADVVSYEGFGSDNHYEGPLWFEPIENVTPEMLVAIGEYFSEHPCFDGFEANRLRESVRVSDYMTLPQFKRTTIYNEFFRLLGTDRQLVAGLHVTPELTITCSLCRLGKDYSRRDCSAMDLLMPHLTAAFRRARFVHQLRIESEHLRRALESAKLAVVSLDENLKPRIENAAAGKLLSRYFQESGGALPDELLRYVKYHRAIFAANDYYLPPVPFVKDAPEGKLLARPVFHSSAPPTTILFLKEIADSSKDSFTEADLTNRESEVLFWVSQGKTDGEIGLILNISPRTVQKHLENTFNKLGAETRTAAVSKMLNVGCSMVIEE